MKQVDWLPHKIHYRGTQHLKGWRRKAFGETIEGPICGSEHRVSNPDGSGMMPARMTDDTRVVTCKRCLAMIDRKKLHAKIQQPPTTEPNMDITTLRQHRADLENSLRNSIAEQIDAFRDKTGFSPQRISVDMVKNDVIGDTEPRYMVLRVDVDIQV